MAFLVRVRILRAIIGCVDKKALPLDNENKNMKSFIGYNWDNMLLLDFNSKPKGIARFQILALLKEQEPVKLLESTI